MVSSDVLDACLADVESRIDETEEAVQETAWRAFLADGFDGEIFTPPPRTPKPSKVEWESININDAQDDYDLMLLSQLGGVSAVLAGGGRTALSVRCNYGVGILSSQYGCEVVTMPREQGNLPTTRPLGSRDAMRACLDRGVPDLHAGLCGKVFEMAERYLTAFYKYPKLMRWVHLYHPDTQGPIDNVELVWGSEMFVAFYDDPDLMRAVLDLMCEQYIRVKRAWFDLVPPTDDIFVHWSTWQKGPLMIRDDSLMNLSPETYAEFVRPCDERLFDEFGGGGIHFCGRGDHFIEAMSQTRGLTGINLSQPELNDMETVYRHTVDKGIKLLGFSRGAAESAGRPLRGQVQCW